MNEGIERAHRAGALASASLMVGAAAAADAVRRARALPSLRVGLHLVVIEGPGALSGSSPSPSPFPPRESWGEGERTYFPSNQLRLGLNYFFRPAGRRRLAAEIRAQFAAFAATGLPLDHANAHKHMHLHPTVGRMLIEIGREYGLRAIRVPAEPPSVLARCGCAVGLGERLLYRWTALLRAQARRAGLAVNDNAFGIAWSGHMTAEKLLALAPRLPDGLSEIYCHPAAWRDSVLTALMPDYEHEAELAALLDSRVRDAFREAGATFTTFSEASAVPLR